MYLIKGKVYYKLEKKNADWLYRCIYMVAQAKRLN